VAVEEQLQRVGQQFSAHCYFAATKEAWL